MSLPKDRQSVNACLNESPRPKAGKFDVPYQVRARALSLNESPRPKAGKSPAGLGAARLLIASMKVPALRRGNLPRWMPEFPCKCSLNESPRPKAGK